MNHTTYKIKCLLRSLRDRTLGFYWSLRAAFRFAKGALYPMRDAPWWFVKSCTAVGESGFADDEMQVINAARSETRGRLMNRRFKR